MPVLVVTLLGLAIGSFLNVCITRLPAGESVVSPGSACRSCRMAIRWYDNIPVLSYIVLAGRCRHCRTAIGSRYVFVELVTAAAFATQAIVVWPDLPLLATRLLFTGILVALFWTDLETKRLPNVLTIYGAVAGLVASAFVFPGITASLIGFALGGGILLFVRWGWWRATGTDGMGLGDVKMLAMIGAFLGWQQVIVVLFLASVAGALVGIALAVSQGRSLQTHLPFGSFLAVAAYTASLVGHSLVAAYIRTLP